jgi:hypothetical protein
MVFSLMAGLQELGAGIGSVQQRLDGLRGVVKDKMQAVGGPEAEHCDPLHGHRPSVEQQMQLFAAFAEWQATCPEFTKDQVATVTSQRTGGSYTYAFADLGSTVNLAHSASKHGLSTYQVCIMQARQPFVRAYLVHQAGGFIYADAPIYARASEGDRRGQDWAGGFTFARRYALWAVLGIAPLEEDEDNNPGPVQRTSTREPAPAPVRPNAPAPVRSATSTTITSRARPPEGPSVPGAGHSGAQPAAPGWSQPPSGPMARA